MNRRTPLQQRVLCRRVPVHVAAPRIRALLGPRIDRRPSLNLWAPGGLASSRTPVVAVRRARVRRQHLLSAQHTLVSDNLLPQAVARGPVYAITGDLILCYNVLFFGSLVAAALAMHLLARAHRQRARCHCGVDLRIRPLPFRASAHIQPGALLHAAVSFLWLHRLFQRGAADTVMLGVAGLSRQLHLLRNHRWHRSRSRPSHSVLVTRRVPAWRLRRAAMRPDRGAGRAAWAVPYLLVHRVTGAGRSIGDAARGGAMLANYLQAPATNLLYGRTGILRPGHGAWLQYSEGVEQELFPGFCALLLALLGCVSAGKDRRTLAVVFAGVTVLGVILSMGPEGPGPLYSFLYRRLFGMAALRSVPRFSVLALLGVAVLAALGVRSLEAQPLRVARGLVVAALLAIAVEYSNGAIAYPLPPSLRTSAGEWLSDQPGSGAVLCVPIRVWQSNTPCMLQSLEHRR